MGDESSARRIKGKGKQEATVFFDMDGTMVPTDMHHAGIYFLLGLPNPIQRIVKLVVFVVGLLVVAVVDAVMGESYSVPLIAWLALKGVSERDAQVAARNVLTPKFRAIIRPAILAEIRRHQREGRRVAVLSGNLRPLISAYCEEIGCDCICTTAELDTVTLTYTGRIVGDPCVREAKVDIVRKITNTTSGIVPGTYGYGNSKNDLFFLKLMEHPFAVTPDSKLRAHSASNGWAPTFLSTAEA
eukprot:Opistho-2@37389